MKEFVEKLIGRLEEARQECQKLQKTTDDAYGYMKQKQGIDVAKEIVKQLSEEYNNDWIPCSERLPEVEADVLLSLRSLDVYTGFRANTEGCFYVEGEGYVELENVLAWQPLPAPFKKGE